MTMIFSGESFWVVSFTEDDKERLEGKIKKHGGIISPTIYEASRVIFIAPVNVEANKSLIPGTFKSFNDAEEIDGFSGNCKALAEDWIYHSIKEGKLVELDRYLVRKRDLLDKAFWKSIQCSNNQDGTSETTEIKESPNVENPNIEDDSDRNLKSMNNPVYKTRTKVRSITNTGPILDVSNPKVIKKRKTTEELRVEIIERAIPISHHQTPREKDNEEEEGSLKDQGKYQSEEEDDLRSLSSYREAGEFDQGDLIDLSKDQDEGTAEIATSKGFVNTEDTSLSPVSPEDLIMFNTLVKDLRIQAKRGFERGGVYRYLQSQKVYSFYRKYRDQIQIQVPNLERRTFTKDDRGNLKIIKVTIIED